MSQPVKVSRFSMIPMVGLGVVGFIYDFPLLVIVIGGVVIGFSFELIDVIRARRRAKPDSAEDGPLGLK